MTFGWLKRYMPRSLYGRAALILILPIVILQLVVSIVFIQRHFEGVTRQMTLGTLAELRYVVRQVNAAPDLATARLIAASTGAELDLEVTLPVPLAPGFRRQIYDLSGREIMDTMKGRLPGIVGIDLIDNFREVQLSVESRHGGMQIVFSRGRVSASNPHQLLVLMISTGILMTVIAYLFLRNQLKPITRLADAASAFGKGRMVSYKPSGASEVRLAGQAFLDMRSRIERQIEQRTLMLSGVSHDLRTPLTRLRLALSLQEENDDTAAMLRDVQDMQRLVDEFLSFARGDALEEAVSTDASALLRDVVDAAGRAGQAVSPGRIDETGDVVMRPQAIVRALENLIGNACRYGTRAKVSLDALSSGVRFRVEDDGPGIPENLLDEAIRPFTRLDPARNQNVSSGVGLGLSIAADIARSHGGTLSLSRSTSMGGLCAELFIAR